MSKIELGPLPEPWGRFDLNGASGGMYNADQMRSYAEQEVARERERCAVTWEKIIATATAGERIDDILKRYNFAIRKGSEA